MTHKKQTVSQKIIDIVTNSEEYTLFVDQFSIPSIISRSNPLVGFSIKSRQFRRIVSNLAWSEFGTALAPASLDTILESVSGICSVLGEKQELFNRIAFYEGSLYYDIGDDKHVVLVTPEGWKVQENAPVAFRRYSHQISQVIPEAGGNSEDILRFFNLSNAHQDVLLLTYIPICFLPHINRPLILIHGSQGSGKSTALTLIRSLIDPSSIPLLSPPKHVEEFIRQASHNYCFYLDNVSSISSEISDSLCRLVSGTSFAKRELFTNDEDILFSFKRVTGFNGVAQFANKPDLLDRSLILHLERIDGTKRKKEAQIFEEFESIKPKILGAIFSCLSYLLANKGSLKFEELPRMADYYEFAASSAVFWKYRIEAFKEAYEKNIDSQHEEAVNASIVATLILEFMGDFEKWDGSSSDLFSLLKEKAIGQGVNTDFPRNPNWLWRKIEEVKPELEAVGILAQKDDSTRPRRIILTRLTSYTQPLPVRDISGSVFPAKEPDLFTDETGIHSTESEAQSVE